MVRRLLPLLFGLLLTSCAALDRLAAPDCDRLTGRAFRPLFEIKGDAGLLETRLLQTGHVSPAAVQRREDEGYQMLDWERDGLAYTAGWNDAGLTFINIRYVAGQVSARRMVACLGAPELYQAWYDVYPPPAGRSLLASLVFLDQGSIAYASQYLAAGPDQPPPIDGSLPVHLLSLFGPGWAEEERALGRARPWPGDWQALKIDVITHP